MNIYFVYGSSEHNTQIQFVKEGFSLFAGVMSIIWMIKNDMWDVLCGYLVFKIVLLLSVQHNLISFELSAILWLWIGSVLCVFAREITEFSLQKRGYLFKDVVLGESSDTAELRYWDFKNNDMMVRG